MSTTVEELAHAVSGPRRGILRRALRQPLLQFLLVGGAIFVASTLLDRARDSSAATVVVDTARIERLAELYRVQMGSLPAPSELEHLIDSHIRDEILFREALKMGLDREDEIVRRRLIQKMEFLHNDLVAVAEPTEAELRHYYAGNTAEFSTAARATFSHIYFSPDVVGEERAKHEATLLLARLDSSADVGVAGLGDAFPLQRAYAAVEAHEIAQSFGRTAFVEAVFAAPQRRWSGPFRSGYGWHLLFVSERLSASVMEFDAARDRVREAYLEQARRAANDRDYAALRGRYRVLRPDRKSGQ